MHGTPIVHQQSDLTRILNRIAADVDELARARRVADLDAAAVLGDRRAERRRQAAEPDLDFREFCRRSKLPQSERSRDLFAAERYRRGETGIPSYETYNPFRHPALRRTCSLIAPAKPGNQQSETKIGRLRRFTGNYSYGHGAVASAAAH